MANDLRIYTHSLPSQSQKVIYVTLLTENDVHSKRILGALRTPMGDFVAKYHFLFAAISAVASLGDL